MIAYVSIMDLIWIEKETQTSNIAEFFDPDSLPDIFIRQVS